MKTIKVAEATNAQLDWLVELAKGTHWSPNGYFVFNSGEVVGGIYPFSAKPQHSYTTDWSKMGPIIDRDEITIDYRDNETQARKWLDDATYVEARAGKKQGLIAATRCYVISKLGNEVGVPDALA
jgi:hypothetical protein